MTPEQKAAFINAQVASMLVEMEGMKTRNQIRTSMGMKVAYTEDKFQSLLARYRLSTDDLQAFFRD